MPMESYGAQVTVCKWIYLSTVTFFSDTTGFRITQQYA